MTDKVFPGGGRGLKKTYADTTVRVPRDLAPVLKYICNAYRQGKEPGDLKMIDINPYHQLLLIFGDELKLNNSIINYLKYHCQWRSIDVAQRNVLFHDQWMGFNTNLQTYFDAHYTQIVQNLQTPQNAARYTLEQSHQTAQEECELVFEQICHMYGHTKQLEKLRFDGFLFVNSIQLNRLIAIIIDKIHNLVSYY